MSWNHGLEGSDAKRESGRFLAERRIKNNCESRPHHSD